MTEAKVSDGHIIFECLGTKINEVLRSNLAAHYKETISRFLIIYAAHFLGSHS